MQSAGWPAPREAQPIASSPREITSDDPRHLDAAQPRCMSTPIDRRLDPRQADFVQPKREQTHVMAPPPLDGLRSANPRAGRRTAPAINAEETSAPTHSRLASIREPDRSRRESEDTRPRRGGRVAEPEARILDLVARLDPRRVALVLALWAAGYAAYRLYYGFGGQVGMIGEPRSRPRSGGRSTWQAA